MAHNRYEIVKYTPDLKQHLIQLQTYLWSRDFGLNGAYFRWKYEENPYCREPLIHLALHEGQIVGMRGMCGARWQVGAPPETFLAPYADDLVVAPEHRNQGVFTQLMRASFHELAGRGLDYVFNFSAGRVTLLGSLTMGWKSAGGMGPVGRRSRQFLGRQRVRAVLARMRFFRRDASSPVLSAPDERRGPFARLDRTARVWKYGRSAVSLSRDARLEAMGDLITRLPLDGRFRHVRDATYFAWRFRNPFHEYRFLYAGDDPLEGYMVLQCHRGGHGRSVRVNVVDWEATEAPIRGMLLDAALTGRFTELVVWTAPLDAETRDLLRRRAFTPIDEADAARGVPGILIRSVRDDRLRTNWTIGGRRLLDLANWDMRMLYSMHG